MKKRVLSLLVAVMVLFSMAMPVMADEPASPAALSGSGTADDPYVISTAQELVDFALSVDGGNTFADQYVILGDDLDLSGIENWNPIGEETNGSANVFNGSFDGKGFDISGMKISGNYDAQNCVGLFSTLGAAAKVANLQITDASIEVTGTARERAGILAGATTRNGGNIDAVYAEGSISVSSESGVMLYGGGLIGQVNNAGVITNSYADVDVEVKASGEGFPAAYAGGLAGFTGNNVVLANCAAFGDVTADEVNGKSAYAGGVGGWLTGNLWNVYSTGTVVSNAETYLGAIAGSRGYGEAAYVYYAEGSSIAAAGSDSLQELTATAAKTEDTAFADTLNANLKDAAEKSGAALRYWAKGDTNIAPFGFVLMNIPYAQFYAAEGVDPDIDIISSATFKNYNQGLAGGSYHEGYIAPDDTSKYVVRGVTYPVANADTAILEDLTEVKDSDKATITVAAGKNGLTTKEVEGKDLLFASGDYAYYVLNETPSSYKTLSVEEDGSFSFSEATGAEDAQLDVEVSYTGHHTNLTLYVDDPDHLFSATTVSAITVTAGETTYALRHIEDIWKPAEIGWNWDDLDGNGLSGKTITNITYYVKNDDAYAVYSYDVEVPIKKQNAATTEIKAAFDNVNTITLSGIPEDYENVTATVSSVVGRGQTPVVVAENAEVKDGKIALSSAAVPGTSYSVTVTSDNYADYMVTVACNAMAPVSIGGVNYYYANTKDFADDTEYVFTVTTGRGPSATTTPYSFKKSDLTQVADTDYYYTVQPQATALSGTLYGYGEGTATNYKEVYAGLGVSADDSYDVISSATHFTGHHAKDIPSLVTYGTDDEGNKYIDGLTLSRAVKTVDATAYVENSILKAAGAELTEEQAAVLDITLKTNPMSAPSTEKIAVKLQSASAEESNYGKAAFAIHPDETVAGYVWSEYWSNVYAATISDGTTTVGAVHWIDLYGEAATSGKHYNTVELALNNGESVASNKAEVNRYKAFFDENGELKAGTYTINIYAEGYDVLTAEVIVKGTSAIKAPAKSAVYTGKAIAYDAAEVTGSKGEVTCTYYADAECTKEIAAADVKNVGTYYVKASVAEDAYYLAAESEATTLTITKAAQPMKLKKAKVTKTIKAAKLKKKAQTLSLIKFAKKGQGKVTYKLSSVSKAKFKKYFKVNAKNGKLTVRKGLKKGTYKVKVKVTAAGNANYKAGTKTVTITIKVK